MKNKANNYELRSLGYLLKLFGFIAGYISMSMIYYGFPLIAIELLFFLVEFLGILTSLFLIILGLILLKPKDKNTDIE